MSESRQEDDIVVSGYDMVSPLGGEIEEQWNAFADSKSGVRPVSRFPLGEKDPVSVAGEVPAIDFSRFPFWNERDEANWFSPVIFHAMAVASRALDHARFTINEENASRVATTFSSAIGGLDAMIRAEEKVTQGRTPHPFTNPNGCLNLVGGKVSILTGAKGPIYSPVAACATGAASVANGAMLLKLGRADVVIAGASDFPVLRSLLASFASMNGAFKNAKESDRAFGDPSKVCRPFSADRKGFVISEGAAAIVLTTRRYAQEKDLPIRASIRGIGMTSDARHYVAPSLPTVIECIKGALIDAEIGPGEIDSINAHAASTKVGDAVEAEALKEVFDSIPPIAANKSQIGHTMGASSAIELILSIEGLLRGILLPTINYQPDAKLPPLEVVPEGIRHKEQRYVLSNSFGFGGCNVCLVVSR